MSIEERRRSGIRSLVSHWVDTDPDVERIVNFEPIKSDDEHRTVLLLQVTTATPPSEDRVLAYGFAPSAYFLFQLSIAQVLPEEWKQIQAKGLLLPEGWDIVRSTVLWERKHANAV